MSPAEGDCHLRPFRRISSQFGGGMPVPTAPLLPDAMSWAHCSGVQLTNSTGCGLLTVCLRGTYVLPCCPLRRSRGHRTAPWFAPCAAFSGIGSGRVYRTHSYAATLSSLLPTSPSRFRLASRRPADSSSSTFLFLFAFFHLFGLPFPFIQVVYLFIYLLLFLLELFSGRSFRRSGAAAAAAYECFRLRRRRPPHTCTRRTRAPDRSRLCRPSLAVGCPS